MAIKTRNFNEARQQASTNVELIWWVFMRVSGVLLVFLVLGHIYMNNILISNTSIDYDYVATRFSQPLVKVYDLVMLVLALLHGTNGLRYVIDDYVHHDGWRNLIKFVLYFVVAVLIATGTMLLFSFPFNKVGG
jgi:succinate dehydrogenase / fumarate reductase membrane anchor subunit